MEAVFSAFYKEQYARVLCLGDVVGQGGRNALASHLPTLRKRYQIDFVMVNAENAAGGIGLTKATAQELFQAGANVLSTGNHVWRHKELVPYLLKEPRVLRPANYPDPAPGTGIHITTLPCGSLIAAINLQGRVFMSPLDCPFRAVEKLMEQIPRECRMILVDFHAEATSEKRALALFLDGRVSFVFGTHTHVQTADLSISAAGTGSLTDLGMCGVEADSVLGMQKQASLMRFLQGKTGSFSPAQGKGTLNGSIACIDKATGQTVCMALIRGEGHACLFQAAPFFEASGKKTIL